MSRVVRTYGTNGQPSAEKAVWESPAHLFLDQFSGEERAQLDPAQMQVLNKGLNTLIGGSGGETSYAYDAQDRVRERRERSMLFEMVTTVAYKDSGDVAEERTTYSRSSSVPVGVVFSVDENGNLVPNKPTSDWPPQPDLPKPSAVHYRYQYDSYGNWTEKATTHSEGFSFTTRRELTYY